MNKIIKNIGQSTLEYLIVLALIIAIIIVATRTFINPAVNDVMGKLGNIVTNAANEF